MNNPKILLVIALVVLVAGAGGFFAGVQYQKTQRVSAGNLQALRGQFGQGNRAQISGMPFQGQGRPVSGEVIDRDEKSITVKLADGGSRIVFVGETAKVNKMTSGVKDDLVEGAQVFVTGTENSDGSVTAQSIELNPKNLPVMP